MDNNSDVDVWQLWQAQASEERPMPLDDIRSKAERLERNTRRSRVATAVLFTLLLIKGAVEVWIQEGILEKAADLLLMAALVYTAYRYRKQRLAAPPVALGRTNCVDFYRAELLRQRDLSQDSWGFLLPFVPGLALALLDGVLEARTTGQLIALVVCGVALFAGVVWWNAYTVRRLQREIDALDAL
jgi:hypothetical protein